ncbi:inner membrane CreD family protein [Planctomycetota bacterium]
MLKRIAALMLIYLGTVAGWIYLSKTVEIRTGKQDQNMRGAVEQLWGNAQKQQAPTVRYEGNEKNDPQTKNLKKNIRQIPLNASDVDVDLNLEYRRKGLLWYSMYQVDFSGNYQVVNNTDDEQDVVFNFMLPSKSAIYDNIRFKVGDREIEDIQIKSGELIQPLTLAPNQVENIEIRYGSRGLDEWWYKFGSDVTQVKNFSLVMHTNFDKIDFPQNSISPTSKSNQKTGKELRWKYSNLLSGVQIGMVMPRKLNPGPWVSIVIFYAPISLFLFFFLLFVITEVRKIKIHPMNYFFISAAFFSFHLLLAYLVDHVSIHLSFIICSVVSIALVVSYMRLVVGKRFAFIEVGLSQFVYLVLFSYAFFFEGYTGLAVTILCITTLFIIMQFTGRVDWDKLLSREEAHPVNKIEVST